MHVLPAFSNTFSISPCMLALTFLSLIMTADTNSSFFHVTIYLVVCHFVSLLVVCHFVSVYLVQPVCFLDLLIPISLSFIVWLQSSIKSRAHAYFSNDMLKLCGTLFFSKFLASRLQLIYNLVEASYHTHVFLNVLYHLFSI